MRWSRNALEPEADAPMVGNMCAATVNELSVQRCTHCDCAMQYCKASRTTSRALEFFMTDVLVFRDCWNARRSTS